MPQPEQPRPATKVPDPLSPSELRWRCDPSIFAFNSTRDVDPVVGVIGQDEAVDSLRYGLTTSAPGQNVFVRGLVGVGRLTLVRSLIKEVGPERPEAPDRTYVRNFTQPDRPRLISLPAGRAEPFEQAMNDLADFIRDELRKALSSDAVRSRTYKLNRERDAKVKEVTKPLEDKAREQGFAMAQVQEGDETYSTVVPLIDGKPVGNEEYEQARREGKISDEEHERNEKIRDDLLEEMDSVMARAMEVDQEHEEKVNELIRKETRRILEKRTEKVAKEFPGEVIASHLRELVDDVVESRLRLLFEEEVDFTSLYRVNVLTCRCEDDPCPVVVESSPTMSILVGSIDREIHSGGAVRTSHMMIRAGALLRAEGGYLILDARDLLEEPGAWKALIRTLRSGQLEITTPENSLLGAPQSLTPEPIDLKTKVIILGDEELYYILDAYDRDFPHLFKVLADFNPRLPRDDAGAHRYAGVLARIAGEEQIPHFQNDAVAALVEHGARVAAEGGKLTARFGRIADIAREAALLAEQDGRDLVSAGDVSEAIARSKRRGELPSKRFREALREGTIRVQTDGDAVGQINGLAVLHAGPLTYGFPARITATIGPGRAGLINIEREANLSGAIHTKSFYILGGLLRRLLASTHPLAFDASIAFEQSYGGIDGDSASAAEICCLLSSLTETPIRQSWAITGAIDQLGAIMAIGAVNEKIEGYFDVCSDIGLTGNQGVIIPTANANDLMLRQDVVDACETGRFQVRAVSDVRQALEILTGVPAGVREADAGYPEGTILHAAAKRALMFWEASMRSRD